MANATGSETVEDCQPLATWPLASVTRGAHCLQTRRHGISDRLMRQSSKTAIRLANCVRLSASHSPSRESAPCSISSVLRNIPVKRLGCYMPHAI